MITKNIYDIPYPEITLTDMDEVKEFFDETLLPFLAEKMGLVVRSDLAVMAPDYAPYSYVTFLAPSANADPYLALYNSNSNNDYRYSAFYLAPTTKVGSVFRPMDILVASGAASQFYNMNINSSAIMFQAANFAINKSQLVVNVFEDGRKIISFKTIVIASGAPVSQTSSSGIYFGKIRMRGNLVDTCVVFAQGPNTPWLEDYEQSACSTRLNSMPTLGAENYYNNLGLIYTKTLGKEYLINLDFCIGEDAYIPDVYWYSDCTQNANLVVGSILNIGNKKYVCLDYPSSTTYSKLLIPEEVN